MGLLDSSENSFGSRFNCFFFFLFFSFHLIFKPCFAFSSWFFNWSGDYFPCRCWCWYCACRPSIIVRHPTHLARRFPLDVARSGAGGPRNRLFTSLNWISIIFTVFWFYWILLICIGWNGAKMALPGFTQFKQAWQGLFYSFFTLSDWHLKDVFKDSLCFTVYFKFSHLNRIMIIPYWAQTNFTEDLNCFPGCDLFFVSNDNNAIQSEAESGRQIEWISRTCHHVLHLRSFVNCLRGRARN